jgi:homocysteine S-methyltransferase
MTSFSAALRQATPVVLDGGLASELEGRGFNLKHHLWSARVLVESPEAIEAVHYDYFVAGAQVATTASYQASYEGFAEIGVSEKQASDLFRSSVGVARDARERYLTTVGGSGGVGGVDEGASLGSPRATVSQDESSLFIAGSLGTYGAMLHDGSEYRGDFNVSERDLIAFHRRRAEVLLDAGADLLACETIPQLTEAVALARVASELGDCIAWISLTSPDGFHTPRGEALTDCARAVNDYPGVCAVGVNCLDARLVPRALIDLREGTDKPLVAYPNRGGTWDPLGKRWLGGHSSAVLAAHAIEWASLGAKAIGGCCRTTPDDIAALARVFRASSTHS